MSLYNKYYNTEVFGTVVKSPMTNKSHRITKHFNVPYITYNRRTRVLYENPVGGAFINIHNSRIYFI